MTDRLTQSALLESALSCADLIEKDARKLQYAAQLLKSRLECGDFLGANVACTIVEGPAEGAAKVSRIVRERLAALIEGVGDAP